MNLFLGSTCLARCEWEGLPFLRTLAWHACYHTDRKYHLYKNPTLKSMWIHAGATTAVLSLVKYPVPVSLTRLSRDFLIVFSFASASTLYNGL